MASRAKTACRSSKTDFFLEPPVCITLGYNFGFVTFSFFFSFKLISSFFSIRVFPFCPSGAHHISSIPWADKLAYSHSKHQKTQIKKICVYIAVVSYFSPYVNRQNLSSPSCYFLRIEYNLVIDMKTRRRDNRWLDTETFLVLYIPPLCGNSNPNQLSNCFGSSLMSYSYVEEDDWIASLSLMLTSVVSAVTYIHVYMASCERWSSSNNAPKY